MRVPFLPLGEWFRILLLDVSECHVSSVYILQHLSFWCTWRIWLCAEPVVMYMEMVDDNIYEGLSLVGNLRTITRIGLGIII